ncbi:MAG: hypothetical protein ACR2I2_04905 [Bryobacteraceae bacterium]
MFNGTNRLFFLANYEAVRDRKAVRQIASVPSLAMRAGDFSILLPRTAIYNPATRVRQANGTITAQPFAGNVVPSSLFNPKAVKLLEFYPAPNVPGAGLSNNYQAAEGRRQDADQFTTRVDFVENSNSNWFGRYSHDDEFQISPSTFPKQGYKLQTTAEQALVSNTRVLNPTLVNEFRFSYSGFHNRNLQYNAYVRDVINELGGISGVATPTPETYGTPAISITGFSGFGENSLAPFINNDHIFQWADNLSINIGKHSLRIGGEIRRDRFNTEGNQHPRGSFSFQGQATQNPAASANTGYGFADYLLGQVRFDDGALGLAIAQLRSTSQAYFIDDSWKVRPNLTVSLGLRYEYTPPYGDKYSGALINVDLPSLFDPARRPTLVRSGTGDFYAGLPFRFAPGIQTARDGRLGDRLIYPDRNDFAPRLGVAYSPASKWTLRSGFGVFYVQDIGNTRFDLSRNLAARREDTSSNDFPDLTLDTPFRGIGSSLTVVNPLELAVDPHTRTPYILQYLFNIQRQLTSNLLFDCRDPVRPRRIGPTRS